MGLLAKLERRSGSPENPSTNLADPTSWFWDALRGDSKSMSGQNVNERSAMTVPVVIACVRVLAEACASIPLMVYKRLAGGGKERATDHPNYELLHDRPNPEMTSFTWRELLMTHLALRGNAFVEKERNNRGDIIGLWPVRPDIVAVSRVNGMKVFTVTVNQRPMPMTTDEIMHIPGLGYDGLVGYSPIALARDAVGLAMAAQEHGARFFENGAEIGGVLQHPGKLSDNAAKHLRESFEAKHRGAANAHRVFIAEEGMKWEAVGLSNRDSQYLETRRFQIEEIARIYKVPLHLIQSLDHATNNNIEQQSIDFVTHTLRPWLVLFEQIMNWELFDEKDRGEFFCEFNVDGLLRGDSQARGEYYTKLFGVGALSVNDIRDKENLNPVEGGDKRFVPLNMVTLDKAGDPTVLKSGDIPTPTDPNPPKGAPPTPPPADQPAARALVAFEPMVRDVLDRALQRERSAAIRAAKKGAGSFRSWIVEYETDQASYLTRALTPVARGALAMLATRELTPSDERLLQALVHAQIAAHVTAYRRLAEPDEGVVTGLLDRASDTTALDTLASELAGQIVGALAGGRATRAAAGAPVVNVAPADVHVDVAPSTVNLDLHVTMPKAGEKTATIKDGAGNIRSTITIGTDEAA
jgi:HK97 family phage portal protein